MLAERLAVIGGDDEDAAIGEAIAQQLRHAAHLRVGDGDLGEIALAIGPVLRPRS